jgi:lipopolysaccharide export system protein LptA
MRSRPELLAVVLAATLLGVASAAPDKPKPEKPSGGALFDLGGMGRSKEPITIVADTLDYDYKNNIVVYRGSVVATQGEVKLSSDVLRITLESKPTPENGAKTTTSTVAAAPDPAGGGQRLKEVIATGNVRIDQGTKWATGGRAVFEQSDRTVVLTENPTLHDGKNEVAGDRVVVYLDEDRSVVEGGRKRVKAVLFPDKQHALTPQPKDGAAKPPASAEVATP